MMRVAVLIKPNSKHREEVIVSDDGSYTIFTKSQAIEGRANDAAILLLAKHFGTSKSMVRLARGHTSKYKVFKIGT